MSLKITRRRAITITAAAAGFAAFNRGHATATPTPVRWRGQVLGAEAGITLYHPDRAAAIALIEDCVGEVRRLERQFSLYRPDFHPVSAQSHGPALSSVSGIPAPTDGDPGFCRPDHWRLRSQRSARCGRSMPGTSPPRLPIPPGHPPQRSKPPAGDTGTLPDGAATAPSQPLDVHLLCDHKRVVDLDAEVAHRTFNLRMSE